MRSTEILIRIRLAESIALWSTALRLTTFLSAYFQVLITAALSPSLTAADFALFSFCMCYLLFCILTLTSGPVSRDQGEVEPEEDWLKPPSTFCADPFKGGYSVTIIILCSYVGYGQCAV